MRTVVARLTPDAAESLGSTDDFPGEIAALLRLGEFRLEDGTAIETEPRALVAGDVLDRLVEASGRVEPDAVDRFVTLMRRYVAVDYRGLSDPELLVNYLLNLDNAPVEYAYDKGNLAPPPAYVPGDDRNTLVPDYFNVVPNRGHDVISAWKYPGSCGEEIAIAVIDEGVELTHPDFEGKAIEDHPDNYHWLNDHGTQTLGVLVASRSLEGTCGVAPKSKIHFITKLAKTSSATASPVEVIEEAIVRAMTVLDEGAVLLLEHEVEYVVDGATLSYLPAEAHEAIFQCILAAVNDWKLVFVEPAGQATSNQGRDACCVCWGESDAVMVGGGQSVDLTAWPPSNHGDRVDCFAWSDSVETTLIGGSHGLFGGTSSASAIVAGGIAVLQSILRTAGMPPWSAAEYRQKLASLGGAGSDGSVGAYFDLDKLAAMTGASPGDVPICLTGE